MNEIVETAGELAMRLGRDLIGRNILTVPMGNWPGGSAEVIQLKPDPGASDISFQVKSGLHGEVGVFEYEQVRLIPIQQQKP